MAGVEISLCLRNIDALAATNYEPVVRGDWNAPNCDGHSDEDGARHKHTPLKNDLFVDFLQAIPHFGPALYYTVSRHVVTREQGRDWAIMLVFLSSNNCWLPNGLLRCFGRCPTNLGPFAEPLTRSENVLRCGFRTSDSWSKREKGVNYFGVISSKSELWTDGL